MQEDENTAKALPDWVELEYKHMRTLAGPGSHVYFTHLSKSSCQSLSEIFSLEATPLAEASCHQIGVLELLNHLGDGLDLQQVCLLDPKAERELSPTDAFTCFLFGNPR